MDRLTEIRQRTEAATDGPWERFDTPDYAEIHVLGGKEAGFLPVALADEAYNADFIAHSRDDMEYLLSEVTELTELLNASKAGQLTLQKAWEQDKDELTARAEAAEARADAAVEDLRQNGFCGSCSGCNAPHDPNNITWCYSWKWRGQGAGKGE